MTIRLGDMLIGYGLVSRADLETALERQQRSGGRLGAIFIAMGLLRPDQLTTVLRAQRAVGPALPGAERALAKIEASFGPQHPHAARARYTLARLLLAAGRPDAALAHGETALADHRKALGAEHEWSRDSARLVSDVTAALAAIKAREAAPAPTRAAGAQESKSQDGPALATLLQVGRRPVVETAGAPVAAMPRRSL